MQSILKFAKCIFLLLFSIFLFPICSFCRFQLYDIIVYRPLTNNQQILKKKIMIVVCAGSFSWLQLSRCLHGIKQELHLAIFLSAEHFTIRISIGNKKILQTLHKTLHFLCISLIIRALCCVGFETKILHKPYIKTALNPTGELRVKETKRLRDKETKRQREEG